MRFLGRAAAVALLVCASVVGLATSAPAATALRDLSWSSPSVDAATNTLTFTASNNGYQYVKIGLVGPDGTPLPSQYWIAFFPAT